MNHIKVILRQRTKEEKIALVLWDVILVIGGFEFIAACTREDGLSSEYAFATLLDLLPSINGTLVEIHPLNMKSENDYYYMFKDGPHKKEWAIGLHCSVQDWVHADHFLYNKKECCEAMMRFCAISGLHGQMLIISE